MRLLPPAVALVLLLGAPAAPAGAVTVSAPGQRFAVDFDGRIDGEAVPGLRARADVEVVEFAGGRLVLDVEVSNQADPAVFTEARAAGLGFDVQEPVADAAVEPGGAFAEAVRGASLGGVAPVDVCVGGPGCRDDPEAGLGLAASGATRLVLTFEDGVARVELAGFVLRWLELTAPGLGLHGASALGEGRPVAEAPLALMLLAIAAALGALEGRGRAGRAVPPRAGDPRASSPDPRR